jgi:hypothetical protein
VIVRAVVMAGCVGWNGWDGCDGCVSCADCNGWGYIRCLKNSVQAVAIVMPAVKLQPGQVPSCGFLLQPSCLSLHPPRRFSLPSDTFL